MNRIPHLQPLEHGLVVASCHGKVKEDAHRLRANTIGAKVIGVVQFFQGLEAELNGLAMFFFLPKLGETGCEDNLSVLLARKVAYFACKLLAMVGNVLPNGDVVGCRNEMLAWRDPLDHACGEVGTISSVHRHSGIVELEALLSQRQVATLPVRDRERRLH